MRNKIIAALIGSLTLGSAAFAQDPDTAAAKAAPITSAHVKYADVSETSIYSDLSGLSTDAENLVCVDAAGNETYLSGCDAIALKAQFDELSAKVNALPPAPTGPSAKTKEYRALVDQLVIEMKEVKDALAALPADDGQLKALQEKVAALEPRIQEITNVTNVTNVTNTFGDDMQFVVSAAFGPTFQATVGGRAAPVSVNAHVDVGVRLDTDDMFLEAQVGPQIGSWKTYGVSAKLMVGGNLGPIEAAGVAGFTSYGVQENLSQQGADVAYNGMDVGGRLSGPLTDKAVWTVTGTFQPLYSVVGYKGSDHWYGTGFMQPTATVGISWRFGGNDDDADEDGEETEDDKSKAEKPEKEAKSKPEKSNEGDGE